MYDNTLDAARALYAAGISVVPVATDGSKRPRGTWKQYQDRPATVDELRAWFEAERWPAIGVITGAVSGNLEMAEIEGRALDFIEELKKTANDSGLGPLWDKLLAGWVEQSPSGGVHWFYRLAETPPGNTKLASRPATPEELAANPLEKRKVLAETRGQGGFVVTAPSNGTTHETGKAWEIISGGPATIPTLTPEEHTQFHALLSTLHVDGPDQAPPAPRTPAAVPASGMWGAVSPLDDFEARTSWADILLPHGWKHAQRLGNVDYWTRPGKSSGISASTGAAEDRDRLWVWSSSTEFQPETPYTKPGAYALLNYGDNHSAAASALKKQGYGKDPEISTGARPSNSSSPFSIAHLAAPAGAPESAEAPAPTTGPARIADPATDPKWQSTGNLATVTDIATKQQPTSPGYTDDFNAQLLIRFYGDELRYNADAGRWLWWNGQRWVQQHRDGGQARELAKETIRAIDDTDNKTMATHKKKSLSAAGITNMLVQAATDARLRVTADQLDARGWELNTPAGIIDLRTAELRPPDPESLHTKTTTVAPDFDARSEEWEKFLADTFPDADLRSYVQRLVGYSAIGEVFENILPFGLGDGGNGKGAMFETLLGVLGDYATTAPPGFLMQQRFQGHTTDIAHLHGMRMVLNSETNEDDHFDEAKVKQLAGGDTITARYMRQDNFTFRPTHQMWLFGNFTPGVDSGGYSFWRRLRIVPFAHKVPKEKIIPGLSGILIRENGGAVLAWIARGAAEYARVGLDEPAAVLAATEDYRRSTDTVAAFLETECVVGPGEVATVNQLRNAYNNYCVSNGDKPMKGRALAGELAKHGIEILSSRVNGVRYYSGAKLASNDYRPQDEHYGQPAPGF